MSLLEVLISIGVLSIGLLGVAAVIPVARFQMVEAAKADRGSACAQAALRHLRVDPRLLDPDRWRDMNGNSVQVVEEDRTGGMYFDPEKAPGLGQSFALDSAYAGDVGKQPWPQPHYYFPYNPTNPNVPVSVLYGGGEWTRMMRITGQDLGFVKELTNSLFVWHDDLLFPVPSDETQRPEQFLKVINHPAGYVQPVQAELQGNYSWLVTICPSPESIDFSGGPSASREPAEEAPICTVSVAVFYKRDMRVRPPTGFGAGETPGERQVRLQFLGAGLGGGDVCLYVFDSDAGRPEYLDIKENEWVLISGPLPVAPFWHDADWPQPIQYATRVGVHKWYRIVATGEVVVEDRNGNATLDPGEDMNANGILDPPYREATLAGPDWNVANWAVDLNGDGIADEAVAGLFNGVVGVCTTNLALDP